MKKVALITGGTRGIGLGIAKELAQEGYSLALNGVRPAESVKDIISEFRANGHETIYCQADIGKTEDRENMLNQIQQHFGHLNVLVNNAGWDDLLVTNGLVTSRDTGDL